MCMSSPMFDVPEHFPIEVNANGQGPVSYDDEEATGLQCWCSAGPLCPIVPYRAYSEPKGGLEPLEEGVEVEDL